MNKTRVVMLLLGAGILFSVAFNGWLYMTYGATISLGCVFVCLVCLVCHVRNTIKVWNS